MRRHRERGATLIEFALLLPVLALLALGTIDLARAYKLNIRLESAAREGAAFSQVVPNDVTCPSSVAIDLRRRVSREDPTLTSQPGYQLVAKYSSGGSPFTAYDICRSTGAAAAVSPGDRVRVEVGARFTVLTPILSNIVGKTKDLKGTAEVVVQG